MKKRSCKIIKLEQLIFEGQNQFFVQSHLLTLSTGRSGDSNRTGQTTWAIFARGTISSLATSLTLKRERLQKVTCVDIKITQLQLFESLQHF